MKKPGDVTVSGECRDGMEGVLGEGGEVDHRGFEGGDVMTCRVIVNSGKGIRQGLELMEDVCVEHQGKGRCIGCRSKGQDKGLRDLLLI